METSHAAAHQETTFMHDKLMRYCVTDRPGAVARTATLALNNATLPFLIRLADKGD
ncbi:hypothetical protein [Aeromonas molluscorum]|nr:hypothetical protein [Aeromonas molluscorum]